MKNGIGKILVLVLLAGCVNSNGYLKGVTRQGEKVYLGPADIQETAAYKDFLKSGHAETDKQHYLFQRLKDSKGLEFYHDGAWYNQIEAYRGGMWLMRHRYQKGQDSRIFIRKYIERSEAGNLHLVRTPDGSIQIGSYILYNELDLLEDALRKK